MIAQQLILYCDCTRNYLLMINLVYETIDDDTGIRENFVSCTDTMDANDGTVGWRRFSESGLRRYWINGGFEINEMLLSQKPERYVYSSSTFNGPDFWAGWPGNTYGCDSLFAHVPQEVLADIRAGRAIILIDQLLEGYRDDRLYRLIHDELHRLSLPTSS